MASANTADRLTVACTRLNDNLAELQLEEVLAGERESGEREYINSTAFQDELFANYMRTDTQFLTHWVLEAAGKGQLAAPMYMQKFPIRVAKYLLLIMSSAIAVGISHFTYNRATQRLARNVMDATQLRSMHGFFQYTQNQLAVPNVFLRLGQMALDPYISSQQGLQRIVFAFFGLSQYCGNYMLNSARIRNREFLTFWSTRTYW